MKTYQLIEPSELQTLLEFWQQILRLQDWDVIAKIVPTSQMGDEENQADVHYGRGNRQARISILRPEDYDNTDFPQDMEVALVHELMHLKLAWTDPFIKRHPLQDDNLEVTVDSVAKAMVTAARANPATFYSFKIG